MMCGSIAYIVIHAKGAMSNLMVRTLLNNLYLYLILKQGPLLPFFVCPDRWDPPVMFSVSISLASPSQRASRPYVSPCSHLLLDIVAASQRQLLPSPLSPYPASAAARSLGMPLCSSALESRSSRTKSLWSLRRREQGHWAQLSTR
jgi:hypothetical protein